MTIETRNAAALRDAKLAVLDFEHTHQLTSHDMLQCAEGDPRLASIGGFDLMDWHYALEQVKALSNILPSIHAVEFLANTQRHFQYADRPTQELSNSPESELLLVA